MTRATVCVMTLIAVLWASALSAQAAPRDPPRRLDLEVLYLTGSWVWPIAESWVLGPEVGLGVLEQKTFSPSGDDFTAILHIGVLSATRMTERVTAEVGFRLGVGELRSVSCSGCLPDAYGALTFALFTAFGRLQVGTRGTVGRVADNTFFVWSPVVVGVRF